MFLNDYQVYYSEDMHTIPVDMIEGKCEIRKKKDIGPHDVPLIFDHVFFCEHQYVPSKGSIKQVSFIWYSPFRIHL